MGKPEKSKLWSIGDLFLRFSSVGAIGTTAHYLLLILLVEIFASDAVLASSAGALLGASINYALNYRFTFRSNKDHMETLPKFALVVLMGFAINAAVVYVIVSLSISYLVAQVVATGVVLVWGFFANYLWTFVQPRSTKGYEKKQG